MIGGLWRREHVSRHVFRDEDVTGRLEERDVVGSCQSSVDLGRLLKAGRELLERKSTKAMLAPKEDVTRNGVLALVRLVRGRISRIHSRTHTPTPTAQRSDLSCSSVGNGLGKFRSVRR